MGTKIVGKERNWLWTSREGQSCYTRHWPVEKPRGELVFIHGLGEHSGRYEDVAPYFQNYGWQVHALDLPGHGRTPGTPGRSGPWSSLLRLTAEFIRSQRPPGLPLFLYGHSMGAALALELALRAGLTLTGVIASAPPLRIAQRVPAWKIYLAKSLVPVFPALRLKNGIDPEALSRDPEVVAAYRADVLCTDRISLRLGLDILTVGNRLTAGANQLRTPLLLMHGDADRVADIAGSRAFCERVGDLCSLVEWPGYFHELHHEPGARQVLAHVAAWLDAGVNSSGD